MPEYKSIAVKPYTKTRIDNLCKRLNTTTVDLIEDMLDHYSITALKDIEDVRKEAIENFRRKYAKSIALALAISREMK